MKRKSGEQTFPRRFKKKMYKGPSAGAHLTYSRKNSKFVADSEGKGPKNQDQKSRQERGHIIHHKICGFYSE